MAFGFLVGGFVVPYIKNHRMFLLGSCVVLTATVGGMAGVQPYGQALSCTMIALAGFSVGLVETASRSLLPMSCPDEDLGAALGALGCLGFTTASIGSESEYLVFHFSGLLPLSVWVFLALVWEGKAYIFDEAGLTWAGKPPPRSFSCRVLDHLV